MKTCSLYIKKFSFMWLSRGKNVFMFSKYLGHTLAFFTIQSVFHFFSVSYMFNNNYSKMLPLGFNIYIIKYYLITYNIKPLLTSAILGKKKYRCYVDDV